MFRLFASLTAALASAPMIANAQAAATGAGPSAIMQMVPFVFAVVVILFFSNFSQKKKQNERDSFLTKLERGTDVITTGGILGRIEGLTELYLTLEIAPGTRIKVLRSAIAGLAKNVNATESASGAKS